MTHTTFNVVPEKKGRRKEKRHLLPVIPAVIQVFACKPMRGLRITRMACAKVSQNPPTIGPCGKCLVGFSHAKGRIPRTWPDGSDIETSVLVVGSRA